MQSVGEILEELGFNEDAPIGAQKAFLKHLTRTVNLKQREKDTGQRSSFKKGEQLTFPDYIMSQKSEIKNSSVKKVG